MIDKSELLAHVVSQLGEVVEQMDHAADAQRLDVSKQEGAMQSRYDTHRIEGSWLADAMHIRRDELKQQLRRAQAYGLPSSPRRVVCEGALVYVRFSGVRTAYFILPFAGGCELVVDDEEITVISPDAPIAQQLLGRLPGEKVPFRNQIVQIEEVT